MFLQVLRQISLNLDAERRASNRRRAAVEPTRLVPYGSYTPLQPTRLAIPEDYANLTGSGQTRETATAP